MTPDHESHPRRYKSKSEYPEIESSRRFVNRRLQPRSQEQFSLTAKVFTSSRAHCAFQAVGFPDAFPLELGGRSKENGPLAVEGPPLIETWCRELPPPQLLAAVEQFNRGEYFEQHETLELLWRAETRPVRRLYQGILQIGVAFFHLRRHNYHGVVYMLTRGSAYLEAFAPACQRIDVTSLIDLATSTLRTVEQLGPTRLDEFRWEPKPEVRLTE